MTHAHIYLCKNERKLKDTWKQKQTQKFLFRFDYKKKV